MYIHASSVIFAVFAYLFYIPFFLYCVLITDYTIPATLIGLFIGWLIYKGAGAINIWTDVGNAMQTTSSQHETMKLGKAIKLAFKPRAVWSGFKATTGEICVQVEFQVDERFMNYLAKTAARRKIHPVPRLSRPRNELKPKSKLSIQHFYNFQHKSDTVYFKMQLIPHAQAHFCGFWSYYHGFDHGYIGLVNDSTEINNLLTWEDIENYIYPK